MHDSFGCSIEASPCTFCSPSVCGIIGVTTPKGKNCTLSARRLRGRGPFRVLTPGSFILGQLDDVIAFAASVVTIFPLAQRQEIWNSVWKAKARLPDWIIVNRARIWFHSSFASFWRQVRRLCVAETQVSAEVRRSKSIIMLSCATTARTRQEYLGSSSP